jgi:hypothetical protein
MAMVRGTFFFKDSNGAGFSSTIFNVAANLTIGLQAAEKLAPLWIQLLGENTGLYEVRMSDDLIKRDSQILIVDPGSAIPAKSSPSNFASDDVVCRIEGSQIIIPPFTVRRTLALRGTPTNITGAAGTYNPSGNAAWGNAFKRFVTELVAGGWAVKFRDKTVSVFQITVVSQSTVTGVVTVTTNFPHGFVPGDGIGIAHCSGSAQINGAWNVLTTPTANEFTIKTNQLVGLYIGGGLVNKQAYALAPITTCVPIRMSTHKAGRPFDGLRGRRSVRRQR